METKINLVNKNHFEKIKVPNLPTGPKNIKKFNSFYLNILLLILFFGFFIFFLINCKYGMFKSLDIDPEPFTFNS